MTTPVKTATAAPVKLVTPAELIKKFGAPDPKKEGNYMIIWRVPADILKAFAHVKFNALGSIGFPTKIYCNKLLQPMLEQGLNNVMERGLTKELKTWDGCFMVRQMRGANSWSLHAWGCAFDINAATNQLGKKPTMSLDLVKCFTDAGLNWGGLWSRPDGMHLEIGKIN